MANFPGAVPSNVVVQDPVTGMLYVNGIPVTGIAAYTFTQMAAMSPTQVSDLGDIFVLCTDKHSSTDLIGGSLWKVDVVAQKFTLRSGPIVFTNLSDAPSAVTWSGLRIHVTSVGINGTDYKSNGAIYKIVNGQTILAQSNVKSVVHVAPAATFTAVTPSSAAAGADTLLTSAGIHGLTAAVCVSGAASIYISGGTGWTVGFHAITAIAVDTTGVTIQIDTPYNAGFGTPTIALANTEVPITSVTIPPLQANSELEIDSLYGAISGSGTKQPAIRFGGIGGVAYFQPTALGATTVIARPVPVVIRNRNSTASQIGSFPAANVTGASSSTVAAPTGTLDTSVSTTLVLTTKPTSANDTTWFDGYTIKLRE